MLVRLGPLRCGSLGTMGVVRRMLRRRRPLWRRGLGVCWVVNGHCLVEDHLGRRRAWHGAWSVGDSAVAQVREVVRGHKRRLACLDSAWIGSWPRIVRRRQGGHRDRGGVAGRRLGPRVRQSLRSRQGLLRLQSLFLLGRRGVEVTFPALDGAALHFDGTMGPVKTIVEPTGVADGVAGVVTTPKRRDCRQTVEAGHGQTVLFLGQLVVLFFGMALFVLTKHHSIVVGWATFAHGRAARTITRAVTFARTLSLLDGDGVGGSFQVDRAMVLVGA